MGGWQAPCGLLQGFPQPSSRAVLGGLAKTTPLAHGAVRLGCACAFRRRVLCGFSPRGGQVPRSRPPFAPAPLLFKISNAERGDIRPFKLNKRFVSDHRHRDGSAATCTWLLHHLQCNHGTRESRHVPFNMEQPARARMYAQVGRVTNPSPYLLQIPH